MATPLVESLERARARGARKEALILADRAAAAGLAHPLVFRVLAEARRDEGRFAEAGALLNRALAASPNDPATLADLGALLVREGRAEEALGVLAGAVRAGPDVAEAWLALGVALEHLENDAEAEIAYGRAAELAPKDPAPHAGVAEISRRAGRLKDAEAAAARALERRRTDPMATLVLARTALALGRAQEARRHAEALLIRGGLDAGLEVLALKTLGDAFDRLDRISDAVRAYERMNRSTIAHNAARFGPGGAVENHFAFMARLGDAYGRDAADWGMRIDAVDDGGLAGHVFVLGYPRSGNTLAAAVLGALPEVRVIEERPTLTDVDLDFLRDAEGLSRLARLDAPAAAAHRRRYFERASAYAGDLPGRVLVDMSPLNSLKIPIITKLFPRARIVLCVRDPRDVVFSCWRQSFRVNAATFQMTSVDGAARHYLAAAALAGQGLSCAGAEATVIDYEIFMDDFEAGARALVAGAGLSWSPEALDFAARAQGRALRTASAGQIQSGLFDGRGQWRRYAETLAPALALLETAPPAKEA